MDPNGDETLDDLITGTSSVPTTQAVDSLHEHLSYPSLDTEDDSSRRESSSRSQSLPLFKDRIYVGNLHPSVDEYVSLLRLNQTTWLHSIRYTLVQVFSKFGKITSVDYLFHKSGPLKGKPRGYAFLKYADENVSLPLSFLLFFLLCCRKNSICSFIGLLFRFQSHLCVQTDRCQWIIVTDGQF